MLEGLESLGFIAEVLARWGVIIGIAVAAGVTYIVSLYLWDEFHVGVFTALSVLFSLIGMLIQHKIESPTHKNK
jgi:membrane protein implicated in regulation of membrane protease activity